MIAFRDVSTSRVMGETPVDQGQTKLFADIVANAESRNDASALGYTFGDLNDFTHDGSLSGRYTSDEALGERLGNDFLDTHRSHQIGDEADSLFEVGKSSIAKSVDLSHPKVALEAGQPAELSSLVTASATNNLAVHAAVDTAAASAAAAGGFPDVTNTGVPAGTTMKVYTGTYYVTEDNAVISNLEVHGDIVIEAKNVTMSNIKLVSSTPWHALKILDGSSGFTLTDSEIDGGGDTVNAIYGYGTFLRNNLHDVENGINVTGPANIRDNYIHDLRGSSEAHYDGIENNGAPDMN